MEGNSDDARIARDRYGRPLKDRFGRPIYRRVDGERSARPNPSEAPALRRPIPSRVPHPSRAAETRIQRRPHADSNGTNGIRGTHRLGRYGGSNRSGDAARVDRETRNSNYDPRFPPPGYNPDADFRRDDHDRRNRFGHSDGADYAVHPGQSRRTRSPRRRPQVRLPRLRLKGIVLVLVIALVAAMALVDVRLTRVETFSELQNRPAGTLASNWLLVGSDSRAGLTDEEAAALSTGNADVGQRTDTIMIAHIPLVGKPKLVSIPRDSFVSIPGNDKNKINAAFALGGPPLLIDTVEKNTGIHIDHYAEIGFGGFAGIVDAIGGVEMCPAEAIDDPLAGLNIQAGCQKFDGASALGYVRTRATAMGDLDRVQRQREFMAALMGRIKSPAVWLNPYRWLRLMVAGTNAIAVGDGDHVWHLSWLVLRSLFGVDSLTVPTSGAAEIDYAGDVLLWDEQAAPALFEELK